MALKRDNIAAPVLPKEAHAVAGLGGEVIVRGLLLGERLTLIDAAATPSAAGKFDHVAAVLAVTVTDDDGQPVWTAAQWETFGATQDGFAEAMRLFRIAQRLSGLDVEERQKN